jgi:hypothetical protein
MKAAYIQRNGTIDTHLEGQTSEEVLVARRCCRCLRLLLSLLYSLVQAIRIGNIYNLYIATMVLKRTHNVR